MNPTSEKDATKWGAYDPTELVNAKSKELFSLMEVLHFSKAWQKWQNWQKQKKISWKQRNWVFATNSDFLIPTSLQPNILTLDFSNYEFCKIKYYKFKIWKVYTIRLQIWYCGKDLIPLQFFGHFLHKSSSFQVFKKIIFKGRTWKGK